MPVIMMSGHGTIDTAVEATKYGASAFLEKPITLQKLLRAVEQALVKPAQRLAHEPGGALAARRHALKGDAWPRGGPGHAAAAAGGRAARAPNRASTSTARCARRAMPSRRATSSSTSPRKAAR